MSTWFLIVVHPNPSNICVLTAFLTSRMNTDQHRYLSFGCEALGCWDVNNSAFSRACLGVWPTSLMETAHHNAQQMTLLHSCSIWKGKTESAMWQMPVIWDPFLSSAAHAQLSPTKRPQNRVPPPILVQLLHGPTQPARRRPKVQGGETPPNFGGLRNRPSSTSDVEKL